MTSRLALASLISFLALALQWVLWPWLSPLAWFLFYPAVFLSARLTGFRGGMLTTILGAILVWHFFIPPQLSGAIAAPSNVLSVGLFVVMGILISGSQERLLRTQHAAEKAFFAQAAVGIALVAPDGHWLRVNHKLCQIVGYSEEELLRLTFQDITHPDDLDCDLANVTRMLAGETATYAMEKRYHRKDGAIIWINLTVALVRHADGRPNHFISVVEDIGHRKAVEAALQGSEAALKAAQRLAGIGNWRWDVRTDAHAWSEEIYHIYGRDPASPPAVYPDVQGYFTQESWARVAALVETCLADGTPYECDAEVVRPDGGRRWIVARGEAVRDGDGIVTRLRGTVQDVTARKLAEDGLRKSQAQLKTFVRDAPVGIAMLDRSMTYVATSNRWLEDYGRGHADVVGRNHYDVHPDVPAEWRDIHRQGLAGTTLKNDEDLWIQGDGSRHWLRWVVQPWTDENGAIGGIIISTEDITPRKLAEEEVRTLNADLERRVIERTAELTAANHELDGFAYAVSHDLRAPLRAMSGFSRALAEDYGDQLRGEAATYLDQIGVAAAKMGELIDGILALSRSTRGELQRDPIDISTLATRLLDELARTEPERKVAWSIEPSLSTTGDAPMVEAALRNLLGNAWKYTGKVPAPVIRVYAGEVGGLRGICVADNGAGFDMAHADQLFQPFRRLHRQDEFPGIGIGLATVQRIARRHGGEIRAEGQPGAGATFCFTLQSGAPGEPS